MAGLVKHPTKGMQLEPFDHLDRMFEDWRRIMPLRLRTMFAPDWLPEDFIRVDAFREDGNLVVRAELPGIDPEKDVELTVKDGVLRIRAEHREETESEKRGYTRRELRYGSFARDLPLPEGVTESSVTATYKDGILEVRVPTPEPSPGRKIPVDRS